MAETKVGLPEGSTGAAGAPGGTEADCRAEAQEAATEAAATEEGQAEGKAEEEKAAGTAEETEGSDNKGTFLCNAELSANRFQGHIRSSQHRKSTRRSRRR